MDEDVKQKEGDLSRHAPSVNLAFPPVGWHNTLVHDGQTTTVWACEKTVVMAKQPARENEEAMSIERSRRNMEAGRWMGDDCATWGSGGRSTHRGTLRP